MIQNISLSAYNKFSWQRTAMVADYYWPAIKRQIITYTAISAAVGLASALAGLFPFLSSMLVLFIGLAELAMAFMLYWAPAVFTYRSSVEIETMLPVKVSEKAVFILLYSLVAVPIILYLPEMMIRLGLGGLFNQSSVHDLLNEIKYNSTSTIGLVGCLDRYVPLTTCLFVVFSSDKSRFTKGAVWSIVSLVGLGLISVIWAVMFFFNKVSTGFVDVDSLRNSTDNELLTNMIDGFSSVMLIVIIAYAVLMCWLTVRALKRKQI